MKSILLSILLMQAGLLTAQTVDFFRTDTAYLQGYINEYTPSPENETGLIFLKNEITRESAPIVVNFRSRAGYVTRFFHQP